MANPWDQDPPEDSAQNPWDADPPSDTVVATAPSIPPSGYLTEDQNPPGVIDWLVNFLKGTYRDSGVPITNPQAEMPGYVAGKQTMDVVRETSPYILAGLMTGGAAAPLLTSGTVGGILGGAAIEGLSQAGANVLKQVVNQTDDPLSMIQDLVMGAAFSGVPASIAEKVGLGPSGRIIDDLQSALSGTFKGVMGEGANTLNPKTNVPFPDRMATPSEQSQLAHDKLIADTRARVAGMRNAKAEREAWMRTLADEQNPNRTVGQPDLSGVIDEKTPHTFGPGDPFQLASESAPRTATDLSAQSPIEDLVSPSRTAEKRGGKGLPIGADVGEAAPEPVLKTVPRTTTGTIEEQAIKNADINTLRNEVWTMQQSSATPMPNQDIMKLTRSQLEFIVSNGRFGSATTGDVVLGVFGGIDKATVEDLMNRFKSLGELQKAPDYGTPIERFGLSEAPDNPGIGERVYRNLSRWAGKVIPGIAQQPVKRIETIQGQAILHAFDDTRGRIDAFRNVLTEKIDNIFKANPRLTAEQIRSGNAPAVKELTDALYVTAKEYGLDPNYVRNYLTQVTLPKYAKKLESGMDKLRAQLGPLLEQRNMDLANNTSVAAAEYPRAIEAAIAQADPVIKEAANYLVESGQVKNVVEAFEVLGARTEEAGLDRFGFKRLFRMPFEKARGYRLPPSFYEQDAKKLLNIYADETSKRIPLARAFGANGEKLQAAIEKIATYNPKEAAYISKVSDIFTGKAEQAGGWGAFGRGLSHLVIAGKIGTGLSTVANAFQTLSLTMGKAGAYRMVKGLGMMFTDAGKEIGTKVAGKARTYEEMFGGLSDKSLLGKLSHSLTTATGFNHTNYFNLFYSANVFKPFVEDLAKASKSSVGARARWAQQELADLGINWQKGMTDDQLVAAVHKLSFDSQLMERITNSPMILNDPRWRPLFLLKKYTINQAIAVKDLIGQELSRGNALPIVRLAAGGILGGEVAIEAKNRLTSLLSGEKKYRKEDDWYERVANDLAAVGTMGWLTDMFGAENPQQLGNNITRFITPAALDIAGSAVEEGVTVAKRAESVGIGPAIRKEASDIAGVVGGGLAKTAVQRSVETPGDVAERTKNRRDVEKAAINDLFVKGKHEAAQKRIALWNKNNPEYGFKGKEFTNKGIKKIVKKRAEKKYEAEQ